MAKIDVTNEIRNVNPGSYQVAVSLLSSDGVKVIATKAVAVTVAGIPLVQDVPAVVIG